MPYHHRRTCPLCGRSQLLKLSNHLKQTHRIVGTERRDILRNVAPINTSPSSQKEEKKKKTTILSAPLHSTMQRLERNLDYLKVLCRCNSKQCKALLAGADSDLIKCLCECTSNVIKGNIPVTSGQKKKLSKHKTHLRLLSDKKVPLAKKKAKLVQRGGFLLPLLLPAVMSAVPALIQQVGKLFSGK